MTASNSASVGITPKGTAWDDGHPVTRVNQLDDSTAEFVASGQYTWNGSAWAKATNSFSNLAANATTLVKTGAGILHSITINTKGASSNTCTVYDGLTAGGTKIATIDTTANVGSIVLDVAFATGLTIVIGTGTAADITVSYL